MTTRGNGTRKPALDEGSSLVQRVRFGDGPPALLATADAEEPDVLVTDRAGLRRTAVIVVCGGISDVTGTAPHRAESVVGPAATDILRTRELGVPRYNEFRRLLHVKPARSFEDLAGDEVIAAKLSKIYGGDIERVDTIIGMFAEKKPEGFGFSDTAFRVFILMASRRLNSDRYFTTDFTTEMYTQVGMNWVQDTTMVDVLLRHYPELRPAMRGVTNAFQPWMAVNCR